VERALTRGAPRIVVAALVVLLLAAGFTIHRLQRHVDAVSPRAEERHLVDRAVNALSAGDAQAAAELRRMHALVFDLGERQCVDFRPREKRDGSGLVCFGRDGRVELEIQRAASLGS